MAISANQLFLEKFNELFDFVNQFLYAGLRIYSQGNLKAHIGMFTKNNNLFMERFKSIKEFNHKMDKKMTNRYYIEIIIIKTCCYDNNCYCHVAENKYSISLVYRSNNIIFKRKLASFDFDRKNREQTTIYEVEKNIEVLTIKEELYKEAESEYVTDYYEIILFC